LDTEVYDLRPADYTTTTTTCTYFGNKRWRGQTNKRTNRWAAHRL